MSTALEAKSFIIMPIATPDATVDVDVSLAPFDTPFNAVVKFLI
jgi:hypothetical protein